MNDICPIMSRNGEEVDCTWRCAWFDTELKECAVSRINANLKNLDNLETSLDGISAAVNGLEGTLERGLVYLKQQ